MTLDIFKLQKKININFKKTDYLIRALTHKSFDSINSYEKLEFLGDRVLGLIISQKLLEIYPNEKEGVLDKKFASLVNHKRCFEVAKTLQIHNYLLVDKKKKKGVKIEEKIVADCCEALIGAIYLDQGFDVVEKFILKFWKEHLKASIVTFVDSKTKLQEYSLKKYKTLPIYKLLANTGPRHKPIFKVAVKIDYLRFISATGNSKKDAEQKAATQFLKFIGI